MMNTVDQNNFWMSIKASSGAVSRFVRIGDCDAVDVIRRKCQNIDLMQSVCMFAAADLSAERSYPLYFRVVSNDPEQVRTSTIQVCYYVSENFAIPQDYIEVIWNAGTAVNTGGRDCNGSKNNARDGVPAAEGVILIPPIVFGSQLTDLTTKINYSLARRLCGDGIEHIDIDVYRRDYFIRMPNSINSTTCRFVTPLQIKELLYMDASQIAELSKKPRPEDSLIMPRPAPEASDWFAEVLADAEKHEEKQTRLQAMLLEQGWQIPPCIRRLQWADLGKDSGLEACRITTQYYSFIKASEYEIRHLIQTWARRNAYKDYQRLKAIIAFAIENPQFTGCEHKLLKRFCPAGKCFIAELINEYKNPRLFEQV